MTTHKALSSRHKCRRAYCHHQYDDVIGQKGWTQHAQLKGAECIPCMYAIQMVRQGQTIEQIEAVPQLMQMFTDLLANTGWDWNQVKESYRCVMALAPAARDMELCT